MRFSELLYGFFYKTHPEMLHPGNNDAIVPTFIAQMLPPGISGLVIAGIFAASMSSLDSGMHSAATAYVTDFHRRIWKKLTEGSALRLARLTTVVFGLLGTGFAFILVQVKELPIFDAWVVLINLIVGGYGGAFLLGVFTRKATGWGTFIGIFFGALVPYLVMTYTHIHFYAWGGPCGGQLFEHWLPSQPTVARQKEGSIRFDRLYLEGKKAQEDVDSK